MWRRGLSFVLNCEVGRDITLDQLRQQHDRVLLAQGCYQARTLKAPGIGERGVVAALDFLTAANRAGFGEVPAGHKDGSLLATDKRVIVIGGGDTAMDCVRTSVRQGAKSVQCLYRRDEENMPGSRREIKSAREEGVEFIFRSQPVALKGDKQVEEVITREMVAGAVGADGRRQFTESERKLTYPADLVILALGFTAESVSGLGAETPDCTPWDTVRAEYPSFVTSLSDVYAAGDIVRGASLVVWAVREGRDAANGILRSLEAESAGEGTSHITGDSPSIGSVGGSVSESVGDSVAGSAA